MTYRTPAAAAAILVAGLAAGSAQALTLTVLGSDCDPNTAATSLYGAPKLDGACGASPDSNGIDRRDSGNVNLGAADGLFFSLGLDPNGAAVGGAIEFAISPGFTGPGLVVEVTNPSNHWEAAAVAVANQADFSDAITVGMVDNGKGGSEAAVTSVNIVGTWKYLALIDNSIGVYGASGSDDGFDLDAITVQPIPLPAGVLLLGTALAGLGMAAGRTRRG